MRDPANVYYPKGALQQAEPLTVCRAVMLRTATHKLVHRPLERSELYDLRADPHELANLHDDPVHAATQRALERRLLDWSIHTSDTTPFDEHPRGYTAPSVGALHPRS
jgi:arylsulfatase A-like enzyme